MKITEVSTTLLAIPLKQPIKTAIHFFGQFYHVVVEVKTDTELKPLAFGPSTATISPGLT